VLSCPWSLKLTSGKWKITALCCSIAGFHGSLSEDLSAGKQRQAPDYECVNWKHYLLANLPPDHDCQALSLQIRKSWDLSSGFPFYLTVKLVTALSIICGKALTSIVDDDIGIWNVFKHPLLIQQRFSSSVLPSTGDTRVTCAVPHVLGNLPDRPF
jgi:hypothetical protein